MGLAAPRHVGSSQTRARTRVSCIGRWILNHCTTREVPKISVLITILYYLQHALKYIKLFILVHFPFLKSKQSFIVMPDQKKAV